MSDGDFLFASLVEEIKNQTPITAHLPLLDWIQENVTVDKAVILNAFDEFKLILYSVCSDQFGYIISRKNSNNTWLDFNSRGFDFTYKVKQYTEMFVEYIRTEVER